MKYREFDEGIEIYDTTDFDVKQTLECGQVFRYKVRDFGYTVYTLNQKADIYCQKGGIKIFCKDKKYFINYFDFYTNYDKIKSSLKQYPNLTTAIEYGKGIRILRSSPLEMVIQFIISQNNNIPRIRQIIEKICENYGERFDDYYGFPTLDKLKTIPLEFFTNIKCGYRDKYLYKSIQMIGDDVDLDQIDKLSTDMARQELMKLYGVGRKVADCILLFGYHKTDVFPTDTWVVKAFNQMYQTDCGDAIAISKHFVQLYGQFSGYAQQYLFYQTRESNLGEKI